MNILIGCGPEAGQDLAQRTPMGPERSQSRLCMRVTGDYDAGNIFLLLSAEARRRDTGQQDGYSFLTVSGSFQLRLCCCTLLKREDVTTWRSGAKLTLKWNRSCWKAERFLQLLNRILESKDADKRCSDRDIGAVRGHNEKSCEHSSISFTTDSLNRNLLRNNSTFNK